MDQKALKEFIKRRHPEYETKVSHWDFLAATYEGGRPWFGSHIFRYIKEGDQEYTDRVTRAYRFNHTRQVVDLVDKYLFKMDISRAEENAPESVKRFWKRATLSGMSIEEFARKVSNRSSVAGRIWIVVDNTSTESVHSVADEKDSEVQTYAYIVMPQSVLDMSYDDRGELRWILIHEQARDDEDPLTSSGKLVDRYRLWTREDWTLFEVKASGRQTTIEVDGPHAHEFGAVPVFPVDNNLSVDEQYTSPALIDDVAYLDRAVANYLSNLDAIIQDQTFSQLVMPAQGLLPGEEGYTKLMEMGTKRIFTYDAEGGGKPEYIGPDPKQAELVVAVITKIVAEIYHTVGMSGERTKDDNGAGIDNSSGVAKAYDFERMNSVLTAKAHSLEFFENKLATFVARWHSEHDRFEDAKLVSYPDSFDVRGLYDEFDIATRLSLVEAPDQMRRFQMEKLIDKLFPQLAKDLRQKMINELKSWPPEPELLTPAVPGAKKSTAAGSEKAGEQKSNKDEKPA